MRKHSKARGWSEAPSSSDLAALVRCEREFVAVKAEGEVRTELRESRARAGVAEHSRSERAMLAHHNAPRSRRDTRCFIATELYGLEAPRTEALRAWRDRVLLPNGAGRCLTQIYYATSPFLVRAVRRWPGLRPGVSWLVDRVVQAVLPAAPR